MQAFKAIPKTTQTSEGEALKNHTSLQGKQPAG